MPRRTELAADPCRVCGSAAVWRTWHRIRTASGNRTVIEHACAACRHEWDVWL